MAQLRTVLLLVMADLAKQKKGKTGLLESEDFLRDAGLSDSEDDSYGDDSFITE